MAAIVFVERRGEKYVALQNKKEIASGSTQAECAERARKKAPDATILGERQLNTAVGHPDKWRHLLGPKKS